MIPISGTPLARTIFADANLTINKLDGSEIALSKVLQRRLRSAEEEYHGF